MGSPLSAGVAGMPSAFVATYGSGGPTIGVMAELDALPELSQEAVPIRSPAKRERPVTDAGTAAMRPRPSVPRWP